MVDIIGISGKIGVGKDFLARKYFYPLGYHRWSLADHFKIFLIGKGEATYEEVFKTKPPHIRDLLQKEGTERGRKIYGEDVWVRTSLNWMDLISESWGIDKFIVPDVRFKNEVAAIQNHGGRVFRIVAPIREQLASPTEEARNHISETELDDFPLDSFNGLIFNDPSYENMLGMQIRTLLGGSPIEVPTKPEWKPAFIKISEEDEIPLLEKLTDQFEKVGDSLEKVYNIVIGRKNER